MSTIVCAVSGHPPEEPVFCSKTGHMYEKRIIVKHVESTGKCPVTKMDLTKDDLVDVKANKAVRPRPASATSIPGMLTLLQSEWDALMSETYELKTHLDTTRKQLSHALYQHDAACRVIARLLRERDSAREEVVQLQEQLQNSQPLQGPAAGPQPLESEEAEIGLTPNIISRMSDIAKTLSRTRKGRSFPQLAPIADVKRFACTGAHSAHQSTAPGILCLDVHKAENDRIVTGGVDSQVILFNRSKEKTVQKLVGHSKKVVSVLFHPTQPVVLSASQDATAKVWTSGADWESAYSCTHTVRRHQAVFFQILTAIPLMSCVGGGRFIVFEGPDGAGKSTQISLVEDALKKNGDKVAVFRDPDYETHVGQVIKDHLDKGKTVKLGEVEARLVFAAGRHAKQADLTVKLQEGCTVLSDRYAYSGVACGLAKAQLLQKQGKQIGQLNQEWLETLDTGLIKPDLVIYFRIEPAIAANRGGDYGNQVYEKNEFQEALVKVLDANTKKWGLTQIDANTDRETVTAKVLDLVAKVEPPSERVGLFADPQNRQPQSCSCQ